MPLYFDTVMGLLIIKFPIVSRVKDLQAQDNCICSTKAKPDLTSSFSEVLSFI